MTTLAYRVAIITGAGHGIGKILAAGLARQGVFVVLADCDDKSGFQIQKEIEHAGGNAIAITTDVSRENSVNNMIDNCLSKFGNIDILINNAGVYSVSSVEHMNEEEWDRVIGTNLVGTFLCSKAVTPTMLAQARGRIISVTSDYAFRGAKNCAHYAASKAGIIGFTKALALELAPHGVTVNAICPGIDNTDRDLDDIAEVAPHTESEQIPLGRFPQPEEFVSVTTFLASEAATYVTGQTLFINGGRFMW
jgi:3-oxoacyl-[acyl-carrier protein] reductase